MQEDVTDQDVTRPGPVTPAASRRGAGIRDVPGFVPAASVTATLRRFATRRRGVGLSPGHYAPAVARAERQAMM